MTGEFWAGREAVLGGLVDALGMGASDFAEQLVDEFADAAPWEHDPNCTMCGSWRRRLAEVGS